MMRICHAKGIDETKENVFIQPTVIMLANYETSEVVFVIRALNQENL